MLPDAVLVHRSPGRVRIRIPSRRGDAAYFTYLRERIKGLPLVHDVSVNIDTASVLVLHAPDVGAIDPKAVQDFAAASGLFRLDLETAAREARAGAVADQISGLFQTTDARVRTWSQGGLDLPTLTALGLAASGLVQLSRGNIAAPAWHVSLWYALNIFLQGRRAQSGLNNNEENSNGERTH
jgi:hypothetical protein